MCIGTPMRLLSVQGVQGLAQGRGRRETVDLRLIDAPEAGQWLLVFNGSARERLDHARAVEIDATLDLLQAALAGSAGAAQDPGFELPSAMSAGQLAALTGAPR